MALSSVAATGRSPSRLRSAATIVERRRATPSVRHCTTSAGP